jgi:hypothetical protein
LDAAPVDQNYGPAEFTNIPLSDDDGSTSLGRIAPEWLAGEPRLGQRCPFAWDFQVRIDDTIESLMEKKPKRKSVWFQEPAKVAAAERVLRESKELLQ